MEKMLEGGASASTTTTRKKNKKKSSRRFNDEQIKSLESVFKMENKLEPRKKLEMARELGLHPRQVAIWFQNRRARWKFKQVEQDYTTLQADYDSLTHSFESLKQEKQALLRQLRNLCSQLKEEGISSKLDNLSGRSSENELDYHELNGGGNYSSGFSSGPVDMAIYSDEEEEDNNDDDPIKQCEMIKEEELQSRDINNVQQEEDDDDDDQVTNFELGSLFDQSYNSNWWDVWSSNS